jgi:hypothetical protein
VLASLATGTKMDHTTIELPPLPAIAYMLLTDIESVTSGFASMEPTIGTSWLGTQMTVRTETLLYETPT